MIPAYMWCPICPNRHYLSLNKNIQGRWSIGYVEMEEHTVLGPLYENDFDTIDSALEWMEQALKDYKEEDYVSSPETL